MIFKNFSGDGRIKIWIQDGKVARFSIFSMD